MVPPPPESVESARQLSALLNDFMALVHRGFAGDAMAIMSEAGLTMPQIVALHILVHGPQSNHGLVEKLHLSTSATSHLVDQLVKKGFVDRAEDPTDRRQKRLAITDAGTDLLRRLSQERTDEFARALSSLDPQTRMTLVTALDRAVTELSRDLPLRPCTPSSPDPK